MKKAYLGIDIGSISTKGVIIDEENNIIASSYLYTENNPIIATKKVIKELKKQINLNEYKVVGVGTTGMYRKQIGIILKANTIKNEITAHAIGTLSIYPNVKTIFEIGGKSSKIIIIDNGKVIDYTIDNLCVLSTGTFLSNKANLLNIRVEDFGKIALTSKNIVKIKTIHTVFTEDISYKLKIGYKKEDIVAGLCNTVTNNYLNNVCKGKKIKTPIAFQGGVSKNIGVVKAFENIIGCKIQVDKNSHLIGALGIAILSKKEKKVDFSFDIENTIFESKIVECKICSNNCKIIKVMKNNEIIDAWGNRCSKGILVHK